MAAFQFINKIFLRGVVGVSTIRQFGGKNHIAFSLLHEHSYMDENGLMTVDCTWVHVSAFEGGTVSMQEMQKVCKGAKVEVIGRLRTSRYVNSDGSTAVHLEVVAHRLHVMDDDNPESIFPEVEDK